VNYDTSPLTDNHSSRKNGTCV